MNIKGYAALNPKSGIAPFSFTRRELRPHDVLIDIHYCGICHSDIHQVRDEWGGSIYPMVPGHEIAGIVKQVGASVSKFIPGDHVGVGCMVDSCRTCPQCKDGFQQFCTTGATMTYNGMERDGKTATQGGYSSAIVVDENYILKIDARMDLAGAAPLLCAGITTYSPLKHWNVGPGKKVGVVGLGGLGHMGVKIAKALGAEVTVFTTSESKVEDAKRLGATNVVISKSETAMSAVVGSLDFILNTVSAPHDVNAYLACLRRDGTMVLVGVPDQPPTVSAFSLILGRKSLAGSLIGGIAETQEMLDFCAKHGILSDIETISPDQINAAYERTIAGKVKYRFVIDLRESSK